MAHTDLAACNKALDRERENAENFLKDMKLQIAHVDHEILRLKNKREGLTEALGTFETIRDRKHHV